MKSTTATANSPKDKIKSSLARPSKGTKPTGLHSTTKKGKNFMPKTMSKKSK